MGGEISLPLEIPKLQLPHVHLDVQAHAAGKLRTWHITLKVVGSKKDRNCFFPNGIRDHLDGKNDTFGSCKVPKGPSRGNTVAELQC